MRRTTPKRRRFVDWLVTLEYFVIASLMVVITLLTLAQVFWRYILEQPIEWSEEIARYCFVWVTFLGAAALLRMKDGHPAIDTLYQSVSPKLQRIMNWFSTAVVMVGCAAIAVGGIWLTRLQWHQLSASLEIPMAYVYVSMGVGPLIGLFWTIWCARHGYLEDEHAEGEFLEVEP